MRREPFRFQVRKMGGKWATMYEGSAIMLPTWRDAFDFAHGNAKRRAQEDLAKREAGGPYAGNPYLDRAVGSLLREADRG